MEDKTTVTVPSHYSCIADDLEGYEETYTISIKHQDDGSFQVTGPVRRLMSFVDDLTMGDHRSIEDIWGTEEVTTF